MKPDRFDAHRQAFSRTATFEKVPDIGDEAHFFHQGAGRSTQTVGVLGRVGSHVFVVSDVLGMNDTVESVRPPVLALAKAAAAKLR